jgi:hypothetical protein
MAKLNQDARISAGDEASLRILILDETTGEPASLSTPFAVWALGSFPAAIDDETPLVKKTTDVGGGARLVQETVDAQLTWVLYVDLEPDDTWNIPSGQHHHEARITSGGIPATVTRGVLTIDATIIRD